MKRFHARLALVFAAILPAGVCAAADLASVTTSVGAVNSATTVQATLRLDSVAPTGGITIALSTSDPLIVVPASVKVGAGTSQKAFTVSIKAGTNGWYTVSATLGSTIRKVGIRVVGLAADNTFYEEAISVNDRQQTGNLNSGAAPSWGDGAGSKISADSRFVVFTSPASNLVAGDTNGKADVFLRDRTLGTTKLISRTSGAQSNGNSYSPAISADGTTVAFVSEATNLPGGDLPGADIFIYTIFNNTLSRVTSGNGPSYQPCLSRDGSLLAFTSEASNLVFADPNEVADVFVYDRAAKSIQCATPGANGPSGWPSIVGQLIAFESQADNLVTSDFNGYQDIFIRDLSTQTTTRASVWGAGATELDGWSYSASLSGDGQKLLFVSAAPYPGMNVDESGYGHIFIRNLTDGSTKAFWSAAEEASISYDGRFIVSEQEVQQTGTVDVFVNDQVLGRTSTFNLGKLTWSDLSISEDGKNVVCAISKPVGVFDFNLKTDVALVTVNAQRPVSLTYEGGRYSDNNKLLGAHTYAFSANVVRPGPAAVEVIYSNPLTIGPTLVNVPSGEFSGVFNVTLPATTTNKEDVAVTVELLARRKTTSPTYIPLMTVLDNAKVPLSGGTLTGVAAIGFPAPPGGQAVQVYSNMGGVTPNKHVLTIAEGQMEVPFSFVIPARATPYTYVITTTSTIGGTLVRHSRNFAGAD